MKILFITWDGPQVNYLESLFLPIFKQLSNSGYSFHIFHVTWGDNDNINACKKICKDCNFTYQFIKVLRYPYTLGIIITTINASRIIRKLITENKVNVVMPRSTLPALATLIALHKIRFSFVFDADGLPLDERVDFAGNIPSSIIYRFLRDIESEAVRCADVVLVRTTKAIDILQARAGSGTNKDKFNVVLNGRDTKIFNIYNETERNNVRKSMYLGIDTPLIVYAGSIGPQYCVNEMFKFFTFLKQYREDAHFLILTNSPKLLSSILKKYHYLSSSITTISLKAKEVPRYISCADLGLALRKNTFSMQAVAPIKIGEYLLCGVPILASASIGDVSDIASDVGMFIHHMDDVELNAAASWFIKTVLLNRNKYYEKCRQVGLDNYSLEFSRDTYLNAFKKIPIT